MTRPHLILVRLAGLALVLAGCSSVPVAASLDEDEANRVVVALLQGGLDAEKDVEPASEGRFRVMVSRGETAAALRLLQTEQLPRRSTPAGAEALGRGSLLPSPAAEHAQTMAVVRADLEQTLQSVDGVLHVRVHLDAPRAILGPAEATKRPTASILLEHRGTAPPLPMADIQKLVAGAWVDLNPSDVAVVFISRPVLADSAASSPLRKVGPVWVAPSSARPLQWLLGLLCGLTAVFASSTMALYRKMRLQRFEASPREP